MSDMEPEVRDFLKRISLSIFAGLAWLFINVSVGIYGGWMFFYDSPTTGNIIFYTWLVISLALLIRIYLRLWKGRLD